MPKLTMKITPSNAYNPRPKETSRRDEIRILGGKAAYNKKYGIKQPTIVSAHGTLPA